MPKERDTQRRYVSVLSKILKECEKYPVEIFDNGRDPLTIFSATPIQDECAFLYLVKIGDKIGYGLQGSYFSQDESSRVPARLTDVARNLKSLHVSPENIALYFKEAIIKPLGEYLARKKLANLEEELLKK
ncbi:hypothetical protein HYW74_01220 [Candidatus Pacearchaeota archaeon]|nr:hypothetical protein [Candidatus Pacearchaeota archaeon]